MRHPLILRFAHWMTALAAVILIWSGLPLLVTTRPYAFFARYVDAPVEAVIRFTQGPHAGHAWHYASAALLVVAMLAFVAWQARGGRTDEQYPGAQRIAYRVVRALLVVQVFTGIVLWLRKDVPLLIGALGGRGVLGLVHFTVTLALVTFALGHVALVARAGFPTFIAMVCGEPRRFGDAAGRRSALRFAAAAAIAVIVICALAVTAPHDGVPPALRWALLDPFGPN